MEEHKDSSLFTIVRQYICSNSDTPATELQNTHGIPMDEPKASSPSTKFLVLRYHLPRLFKGLLVLVMSFGFVIQSIIRGLLSGIHISCKIGLYVQLVVALPLWLLVVLLAVKFLAIFYKKHLIYLFWKERSHIVCFILFLIVWITALGLFLASMIQKNSSGGVIALFVIMHIVLGFWFIAIFFGRIEMTGQTDGTGVTATVTVNPGAGDQTSDTGGQTDGTGVTATVTVNPGAGDQTSDTGVQTSTPEEKERNGLAEILAEPPPRHCHLKRFLQFVFALVLVIAFGVWALYDASAYVYSSKSDCVVPISFQHKRSVTNIAIPDICKRTWNNLNILDLAVLAEAAYQNDEPDTSGESPNCSVGIKTYLDRSFPSTDWTVLYKSTRTDGAFFYELRSERLGITIITIRGTSGPIDALQDTDFWSEAALFQLFSTVIPLTSILPDETFRKLVGIASLSEVALNAPGRRYFTGLEKYIEGRLSGSNKLEKEKTLITGHSLGGGLSKMAGARFGIRSFSFNGPGLVYSRGKVGKDGVDLDDINRSVVNVVLQGDLVSLIDSLGGSINKLTCHHDSFQTCHRLKTVVDELHTQCMM
jgi:lipase ATG15